MERQNEEVLYVERTVQHNTTVLYCTVLYSLYMHACDCVLMSRYVTYIYIYIYIYIKCVCVCVCACACACVRACVLQLVFKTAFCDFLKYFPT